MKNVSNANQSIRFLYSNKGMEYPTRTVNTFIVKREIDETISNFNFDVLIEKKRSKMNVLSAISDIKITQKEFITDDKNEKFRTLS